MTSTLDSFKGLEDRHKPLFLAMAGANLTDTGRQAAANELKGLNEIYNRLYKAIAQLVAANKPLDADDLWHSLNEMAKPYQLTVALDAAFVGAKSLMGTYGDVKG